MKDIHNTSAPILRGVWICALMGMLAFACVAQGAAKVRTEFATIAFDNEGTCWLSFVVMRPKTADLGVKLKVLRPVEGAPEPGLPEPKLGPGVAGSWIWIGEGHDKGRAGLFTVDAEGHVTWIVLTPRIAREYLRPGHSSQPSSHGTQPSI